MTWQPASSSAPRPADVAGFVEAGPQLDQHGHFLAVLGRPAQGADDGRIAAGAIERLLDGHHVGVVGGLLHQPHHGIEALVGMEQQHVVVARRRPRGFRRRAGPAAAAAASRRSSGPRSPASWPSPSRPRRPAGRRSRRPPPAPGAASSVSHCLMRRSGRAEIVSRTAARRRRSHTAFSTAWSMSPDESRRTSTSASRVMRKTAVASTSQPASTAATLAAITSSSRARQTPSSAGTLIQRGNWRGDGHDHDPLGRRLRRPGRQHRRHVPLLARQQRRRIQLLHGQGRQRRQQLLGEVRLEELPLRGGPIARLQHDQSVAGQGPQRGWPRPRPALGPCDGPAR